MKYLLSFLLWMTYLFCQAITGNGHVTALERSANNFKNLTIDGPFKLIFSNDPKIPFKIKIETDSNLQDSVAVNLLSPTDVYIKLNTGVKTGDFTKLIVYVNHDIFTSLTIISYTSEASEITLPVHCYSTSLKITGSIPISIKAQVNCHNVEYNKGKAYDKINHAKLILDVNNERTTTISGMLDEAIISNTGTGALRAYALKTYKMTLLNSSKASAEIYSAGDFKINNTRDGHVYYRGEGQLGLMKELVAGTVCREDY